MNTSVHKNRGNAATFGSNITMFLRVTMPTSRHWDPTSRRSRMWKCQRRDVRIQRCDVRIQHRNVPKSHLSQRCDIKIQCRDVLEHIEI